MADETKTLAWLSKFSHHLILLHALHVRWLLHLSCFLLVILQARNRFTCCTSLSNPSIFSHVACRMSHPAPHTHLGILTLLYRFFSAPFNWTVQRKQWSASHTNHVLCVFYDGNLSARQTLQIHLTLVSNPLFYFLCWILNFYLNPVKKKARNNTKHIWHIFVGFSSNITSPGSCLPDGVSESVMFSAMASKSQQVSAVQS